MLHRFSILLMLATLALMAWSLLRGLGQDAFYQFLLGASLALLFRRWHETRQARLASKDQEHDDGSV
ncbi:MAG: hypothetical protein ACAI44_19920 [Candidatus Sericytochromatia bacterium]